MPLTFNPVSVNLPTPPSFAGGQMGAPVDANSLSSLAKLTDIQATRQGIATSQQALAKAQATYGADVSKAESEASRANTEAQSANVKLGNEKMNTMYSVLTPYGSDERILAAGSLPRNATPDQVKATQNSLYDVSDEIDKGLESRGWNKADRRQYIHEFNDAILKSPQAAPELIKRATQTLAGALNIAEQNQPQFATNAAGQKVLITPAKGKIQEIGATGAANPTSGGVASTNEYIKDLNGRNSIALETDMRLGEAEGLLKLIKGGAGTKNFAEIAKFAQSINLPQTLVDSIAGGDLSAVQSAQKFITQAVIQGATANPGTAESINRYIKDNPEVGTDPRALERFINFTKKLNQKTFDETEFLLGQKKTGKFNPETHVQEVQQYLRKQYFNPNEKAQANKNEPAKPTRKIVREGIDKSTGRAVVEYDDGTTGYK
jgi:hypothetical protein